ncbi:siroheme synthase CysG [Candidatus Profftia tarda]|uniref:Siroheme synthase n=1 Tax=Candidatus Profftia tarda TaxID=1177216 RepID=A0A8E4F288_9ENTR|nr:siroheme synthase CysG [Candidatus Profftia tarda]CAD6512997.1 Siroheme synthase [Candidatus Profftia tarda]
MDYLPIFCKLRDKECLLVGGGKIAERKARILMEAGAIITVNARYFTPQFDIWGKDGKIKQAYGDFSADLLRGVWLVIAATNNQIINDLVYQKASAGQIFCNVVDSPKSASFIMPSIIDRSPMMIAISSGGRSPVLSRLLREKLEANIPQHLGPLARLAGDLRQQVKDKISSITLRRRFWERLFMHDRLAQSLGNKDYRMVQKHINHLFEKPLENRGEVILVGAGPGDPGLLTLKGLQEIQKADVIVYDRLVSDDIMHLVRRDAELIFVGKRAGYHCVSQNDINQMMLRNACNGKRVVRLKGGDPFIFGRGGEELEILSKECISFSVVPGITAASGCSAYSGIPLTHRDYAQSVRLVTGHARKNKSLDWPSLAAKNQTLVFYMGRNQAAEIQTNLIKHGMSISMPVALVEKGTSVQQKVITGKLTALTELAHHVDTPSLIIIGKVVLLRDKLNWFMTF